MGHGYDVGAGVADAVDAGVPLVGGGVVDGVDVEGAVADALVQGVDEVSALLAEHFPRTAATRNELSDKPFVL
jgi:hypothetical protein